MKKTVYFIQTVNVLLRKRMYLILIFLSFSLYLRSQNFGTLITLGAPINQKIEQNGIEYKTGGFSPNIVLFVFEIGDESNVGWGGSMVISVLDIRNLPEKIFNNKLTKSSFGVYTGPVLLPWRDRYPLLVINGQVGFIFMNYGAVNSETPKITFSMKTSADFIFGKFSVGIAYRPLDLLLGDEAEVGDWGDGVTGPSYILRPAFELRVSLCFGP